MLKGIWKLPKTKIIFIDSILSGLQLYMTWAFGVTRATNRRKVFFLTVQQPKSDLHLLIVENSRSRTTRLTNTHTNTPYRTPLDERSARRRDRLLHNT